MANERAAAFIIANAGAPRGARLPTPSFMPARRAAFVQVLGQRAQRGNVQLPRPRQQYSVREQGSNMAGVWLGKRGMVARTLGAAAQPPAPPDDRVRMLLEDGFRLIRGYDFNWIADPASGEWSVALNESGLRKIHNVFQALVAKRRTWDSAAAAARSNAAASTDGGLTALLTRFAAEYEANAKEVDDAISQLFYAFDEVVKHRPVRLGVAPAAVALVIIAVAKLVGVVGGLYILIRLVNRSDAKAEDSRLKAIDAYHTANNGLNWPPELQAVFQNARAQIMATAMEHIAEGRMAAGTDLDWWWWTKVIGGGLALLWSYNALGFGKTSEGEGAGRKAVKGIGAAVADIFSGLGSIKLPAISSRSSEGALSWEREVEGRRRDRAERAAKARIARAYESTHAYPMLAPSARPIVGASTAGPISTALTGLLPSMRTRGRHTRVAKEIFE